MWKLRGWVIYRDGLWLTNQRRVWFPMGPWGMQWCTGAGWHWWQHMQEMGSVIHPTCQQTVLKLLHVGQQSRSTFVRLAAL